VPLSAPEWTLSVPYVPAKLVFGNRYRQVAFNPLAELSVTRGDLRPTGLLALLLLRATCPEKRPSIHGTGCCCCSVVLCGWSFELQLATRKPFIETSVIPLGYNSRPSLSAAPFPSWKRRPVPPSWQDTNQSWNRLLLLHVRGRAPPPSWRRSSICETRCHLPCGTPHVLR